MIKIIIFGFPHCGTSILKSIIGHIDDVEEIINETKDLQYKTNKKYLLGKYPFARKNYFTKKYEDYIKIFIIRNPLFVFSSINKRCNYNIPDSHNIDKYIHTIKLFEKYRMNPPKNFYTIKYEELFENNYQKLKDILQDIGMNYTDKIFDNTKFKNKINEDIDIPLIKPLQTEHESYRTWEINQPFVFQNNISKIDLTKSQIYKIINSLPILKIYPSIKNIKI